MATDIHALPPEIIGLIADWIGAMEAVENKRLLGSERRMCICQDDEEERYYGLKETRRDIRFHSDILKLSSLSHYLRNSIFESRKPRGISMPFYRSALDRCTGIRDELKEGVRRLRITVNEDPTASYRDRQTAIWVQDFLLPFPNLTRLEIDHTMLGKRKRKDPRIEQALVGLQVPGMTMTGEGEVSEDDASSTDDQSLQGGETAGDVGLEEGSENPVGEGMQSPQGTHTPVDVEPIDSAGSFDGSESDIPTAVNIDSIHIKMSDKFMHWSWDGNPGGLWFAAVQQFRLVLQQLPVPNLRHLHITWDYDLVQEDTEGQVLAGLALVVASFHFKRLETIKFCIHMHVGQGAYDPTPVEEVLHDMTWAFRDPRWHETDVVVNLIVKDSLNGSFSEYFLPEDPIERLVSASLGTIREYLPMVEDFTEIPAQLPGQTVPPGLKLTLNVYARSAFFEGIVPIARIYHSTATHQHGVVDPTLWRQHFEYTALEPDVSSLVESARRVLSWDVNDATDSDYTPDSDDSPSDSASESVISDSFRRPPTPV